MQELESRTAAYIEHRLPDAEDVRVDQMQRIHGGASRQTYRLRLTYTEGGRRVERRLVLRRDPPGKNPSSPYRIAPSRKGSLST